MQIISGAQLSVDSVLCGTPLIGDLESLVSAIFIALWLARPQNADVKHGFSGIAAGIRALPWPRSAFTNARTGSGCLPSLVTEQTHVVYE